MKKIKTIEAVAAYKTMKALKTSSMSDDAAMRVWKNMKALRHVADTYDKDVEEAQESLKDDKFEEMQRKLQECQQLEQKHADDDYEYTKDDSAKFAEVNEYFFNQKQKTEKYFSDLANAKVEVAIEDVDEKELFKAAKDCGLKFIGGIYIYPLVLSLKTSREIEIQDLLLCSLIWFHRPVWILVQWRVCIGLMVRSSKHKLTQRHWL